MEANDKRAQSFEELKVLNRRVERLNDEIKLKAPKVIINNELNLILDACSKLKVLNEFGEKDAKTKK